MAPEQVMGGKAIAETDIFAVGAVLYQHLTGDKPFEAPTLQSLFYRIVTDMPTPISQLMPGLPPALDRIVRKSLAKDPADRYHNALEMANELTHVRAQLSGAPYPATISLETEAVPAPKPRRAPVDASAVSAITSVPISANARSDTLAAAGASQHDAPMRRMPAFALVAAGAIGTIALGWLVFGRSSRADTAQRQAPAPVVAVAADSAVVQQPVNEKAEPIKQVAVAPSRKDEAPVAESAIKTEPRPVEPARTARLTPRGEPVPPLSRAARQKQSILDRIKSAAQEKRATARQPDPAPTTRTAPASAAPSIVTNPAVSAPQVAVQQPPRQALAPRVQADLPQRPVMSEPAPETAATKTESPTTAVAGVVAAYARAIESRDIGAVRRAYPGLTGDQARGFEQFFDGTRSINVTFRVVGLEANGNSADARLVGSYEYVTTTGKTERQPVSFAATLRNDGSSWRLVSVR
jgi:serine/threonine-protein kinase